MICRKHPKYNAIKRPRIVCEACWYLYARAHWYACIEPHVTGYIMGLKEPKAHDPWEGKP